MSFESLEVRDLLEHATVQEDFPSPLRLPGVIVSECCIDDTSSAAFHRLIGEWDFNPRDSYEPVLEPVMTDDEHAVWFKERTIHIIDVALVNDLHTKTLPHATVWFLLNHAFYDIEVNGLTIADGFAVPAARRVNGSPSWLEPLCMKLDKATYAANVALKYGTALR